MSLDQDYKDNPGQTRLARIAYFDDLLANTPHRCGLECHPDNCVMPSGTVCEYFRRNEPLNGVSELDSVRRGLQQKRGLNQMLPEEAARHEHAHGGKWDKKPKKEKK